MTFSFNKTKFWTQMDTDTFKAKKGDYRGELDNNVMSLALIKKNGKYLTYTLDFDASKYKNSRNVKSEVQSQKHILEDHLHL